MASKREREREREKATDLQEKKEQILSHLAITFRGFVAVFFCEPFWERKQESRRNKQPSICHVQKSKKARTATHSTHATHIQHASSLVIVDFVNENVQGLFVLPSTAVHNRALSVKVCRLQQSQQLIHVVPLRGFEHAL